MSKLCKLLREEDGVTSIEYALIASLIAAIIVLAVTALGIKVDSMFTSVAAAI